MPEPSEAQRAWVLRVLGIGAPGSATATGAENVARLKALGAALARLKSSGDARAGNLLRAFGEAVVAVQEGKPDADARIAMLATALDENGEAAKAPVQASPGFGALKASWTAAFDAATKALITIGEGLLALDEVQRDPRFKHVQKAIGTLPGLLPAAGELVQLIDAKTAQAALAAVAKYRSALAGVPALAGMEELGKLHVGAIPVLAPLGAALDEIETALTRAG